MEILNLFKSNLLQDKKYPSKITVKNYLTDVRKFIHWFEAYFKMQFAPSHLTKAVIETYTLELTRHKLNPEQIPAARSVKRYLSSLKKFSTFLKNKDFIQQDPFLRIINQKDAHKDEAHLKEFYNYLFLSHASPVTIKNYMMDVRQFIKWAQEVTITDASDQPTHLLSRVTSFLLEEYQKRLFYEAKFSAVSVNRKLSSLRKYFYWAEKEGFINKPPVINQLHIVSDKNPKANSITEDNQVLEETQSLSNIRLKSEEKKVSNYSSFPPFRLTQKITRLSIKGFDLLILFPIVSSLLAIKYNFWKLTGRQVFIPIEKAVKLTTETLVAKQVNQAAIENFITNIPKTSVSLPHNFPKAVYAPLKISTRNLSFFDKILHHLRHTRPEWYRKYHRYAFVHYLHFAVFLIYAVVVGLTVYQAIAQSPHFQAPVLASLPASPPRLLAFQGKINDTFDTPITAEKSLRFSLYNNAIATGSSLLWQETQMIKPDQNGNFATYLGKNIPLYQSLLNDNPNLFLGITIGNDSELQPRQQLATVIKAQDSNKVDGLSPITQENSGTNNVLLALDSSGNLTIGGSASPKFEATGGRFTLSGQTLTLTTTEGSNTNIELSPSGAGIIDLQKPIQNTTNYNNIAGVHGAVEFDDSVGILATSSGQSALIINQNSTGDLISASTSGIAKFSISNNGTGTFTGDLSVNGNNFTTTSTTFNLINSNAINLNIGGSATAISIGAPSGITSINNSLIVRGISTLQGAVNSNGLITVNGGLTVPQGKALTLSGFSQGAIPFLDNNKQLTQDPGNFFWDANKRRLGLGTTTPSYRLDIQDDQNSTYVSQIYNNDTGLDADGLNIKLGATTPSTNNSFITFSNGDGLVLGKITGNGSSSGPNNIVYNTSGADYAEYYKKADTSETFEQGDSVCINESGVTKCTGNNKILGVVSTTAGFVGAGNHDKDPNYVLVGITGQLPVKVASESGIIKAGDALTVSPTSGSVIKATSPGMIIGRALEGYQNNTKDHQKILTAITITWYDPSVELTQAGELNIPDHAQTASLTSNTLQLADILGTISIGGQTVKDYIYSIVVEAVKQTEDSLLTQKIVSPLAQTNRIATNIISPLSSDSEIAIKLNKNFLTIHSDKNASSAAVATIDNQGNASFSGTLRAKKIIADDIEGLTTASASANFITNITNVYTTTATPSATATQAANDQTTDLASQQATNSAGSNLTAEFGRFNQGIIALGASSLTDVSIEDQLHVGSSMTFINNSINTIGADLALQPLRQGNPSIMGDLVTIDTQGNLSIKGTASFAKDVTINGKLAVNVIAPVTDQDLLFQLGVTNKKQENKFQVRNGQQKDIFSINQLGDVIASGTANFQNVAANACTIIRGAQADTSFTQTIASGSAGLGTIIANETERTIVSPYVKPDSLIYISPTSNTQGITPYIARQTTHSFTVALPSAVTRNI